MKTNMLIPVYGQLCQIIEQADNSVDQSLVLYKNSKFENVDLSVIWQDDRSVVGGKIFLGNRGYWGFDTSTRDGQAYVDKLYHASLKCWYEHLRTGWTRLPIDMATVSGNRVEIANLYNIITNL